MKPLVMLAVAALAAPAAPAPPGPLAPSDRVLAESAAAILRNDYRADRAELLRLAQGLERLGESPHEKYRRYWIAFAYWRRGFNGLNDTPKPADLGEDFERCATHARAALALDSELEDARGALMGCLMGQLWVPGQIPDDRKADFIREGSEVMKALATKAGSNPRSLWLVGMQQAYRPEGGDASAAIASWMRGLAGARQEALAAPRDPWIPSWGAPEILMNLANFYTYAKPNKAVARAYAEGALAMAPEWHYLREILMPAIEKLPDTERAPDATLSPGAPTPGPVGPGGRR
ncbi:MAG: hypothetical protein U0529_03455 [Thermoanaerobaculia bacterium]